jgi:phage terminase large subunit
MHWRLNMRPPKQPVEVPTLRMEFPEYYQQVLQATPRVQLIGLRSGRGAGKSESVARHVLSFAIRHPNETILCGREFQASIKSSVKSLLDRLIDVYSLHGYFKSTDNEICSKFGLGKIIFSGLAQHTVDSVKSLDNITLTWLEEAQTLSDRSLTVVLPSVLRAPNSRVIFTYNTDTEQTPCDKMFTEDFVNDGTMLFIHCSYLDNPWFPEGLEVERKRFLRTKPKEYGNVWLGDYKKQSDALIHNNWLSEDFELRDDDVSIIGLDFGYTDLFGATLCTLRGNSLYISHEAVMKNAGIDVYPTLLSQLPNAEKLQIIADSSRPESIKYIREHGFPKIFGSLKGPNSVAEGIKWMQSYDEIVIHPRCTHTIEAFGKYSYDVDKRTGIVKQTVNHAFSDVPDSARYAVEALRRGLSAYAKQQNKPAMIPPSNRWGSR